MLENLPKKWNGSFIAEVVKSGDSCDCMNLVCNADKHPLKKGRDICTEMSKQLCGEPGERRKEILKKVHALRQEGPLDLAGRNSVQALEL